MVVVSGFLAPRSASLANKIDYLSIHKESMALQDLDSGMNIQTLLMHETYA